MTLDQAVALSLLDDLPRPGLTARMCAGDPELLDRVSSRLAAARDARVRAEQAGIHVVAWNDPRVPASLTAIGDCPPALWCRGDLSSFDAVAVAIVGSRAASHVALETAARIASDLASKGVVVVSGLARGVDSAAHRGALRTGRTIAVLGSGLDRIYPAEHGALAREIAGAGLVLSEYPPATPPLPFHFPMRNRLISGLARAVVVIEAHEKSGSLITASCALEQGRDVMAVPGNVLSGRNRGGHALIRDGAKIVESADDILGELGLGGTAAAAGGNGPTADLTAVSADPVLRRMDPGQPYDLDVLAGTTGLEASRLLPRLIDLELRGLVQRIGGGRFVRP